ncbi:D-alanine aminotransferase [Listeria grayi]|uniref:D-alanine aminotransferase n=1 Tax=Listeria grayi TaxID=1641 RepID=A0A378MAV3_LISGR|nr:D-alanine aminotransferase [Listeria grayi]
MKVLVNDKLVDRSKAAVDIEDRGYQFGDGVYEVIRLYNKNSLHLKSTSTVYLRVQRKSN